MQNYMVIYKRKLRVERNCHLETLCHRKCTNYVVRSLESPSLKKGCRWIPGLRGVNECLLSSVIITCTTRALFNVWYEIVSPLPSPFPPFYETSQFHPYFSTITAPRVGNFPFGGPHGRHLLSQFIWRLTELNDADAGETTVRFSCHPVGRSLLPHASR